MRGILGRIVTESSREEESVFLGMERPKKTEEE